MFNFRGLPYPLKYFDMKFFDMIFSQSMVHVLGVHSLGSSTDLCHVRIETCTQNSLHKLDVV